MFLLFGLASYSQERAFPVFIAMEDIKDIWGFAVVVDFYLVFFSYGVG